jgi:hypothetical protein
MFAPLQIEFDRLKNDTVIKTIQDSKKEKYRRGALFFVGFSY